MLSIERFIGVMALALLLPGMPASAQPSRDGHLIGTVRDSSGGVVASATVIVESPSQVGGPRKLSTAGDGTWRASRVPAGIYSVTVDATGFRSARRTEVSIFAGQTLTIDLTLDIAGVAERAHVDAPAPIVDVTGAAVPSTIDADLLRDVPTSRDIAQLINLVPGVAGDVAFGGSKMSNGLYVEGVDITASDEQGPWLRFNESWLQEVQIVGLGADAQHGKFTGVSAHGIVRSGSNRLTGVAEYLTTRSRWLANNTRELSDALQRSFAPQRIVSSWNLGGQVGGPVLADRVWFFGGIDRLVFDRTPAGYDGPFVTQEDEARAIGRITAAARGWRLDGLIQAGRQQVQYAGIGPLTRPEATSRRRQPQASWNARALSVPRSAVTLEMRYAGYNSPAIAEPMPPASMDGPPARFDQLTGVRSGNFLNNGRTERHRHLLGATASWITAGGRAGLHQLDTGIEAERAREQTWLAVPGGILYYDYDSMPYLRETQPADTLTGDTSALTLFLQDRWQIHERVTLLPGLRFDAFRGSTPQMGRVFATNPVSPRIGVAWSLGADHRAVVRAHYGRYTDPVFAQPVLLTDIQELWLILEQIDQSGAWHEISRRSLVNTRRIDTGLDHPHVDQLVAGFERQIGRDGSVQVQYIRRKFGDFLYFAPHGGIWTTVERRDPGPDGLPNTGDEGQMFTVYSLTNPSDVYNLFTNPDDAWRNYHAVQVVGRKRFRHNWQMQASYTWSRARGTIANGFHGNSGIRGIFGNPNQLINGDGQLPADPTNEVKLLGSWRAPWLSGFTFGGVYRYNTGAAWGRTFVARDVGQGTQVIRAEPRGTRRVAAVNNVDLRIEKGTPLAGGRRLSVIADLFNLTNQGVPDSDLVVPVIETSGPALGLPAAWRQPRQLRVGLRLEF